MIGCGFVGPKVGLVDATQIDGLAVVGLADVEGLVDGVMIGELEGWTSDGLAVVGLADVEGLVDGVMIGELEGWTSDGLAVGHVTCASLHHGPWVGSGVLSEIPHPLALENM